jgi:hypothetical protein
MTPDPKPVLQKLLANPQDLNLYVYTINNPLRYYDPDGKDWQQALSDVKAFFGSIQIKFSGGLGLKVAATLGPVKAEVGVAAKGNYTVSLGGDTKSTTSLSAD